jgi:hypothetical protein
MAPFTDRLPSSFVESMHTVRIQVEEQIREIAPSHWAVLIGIVAAVWFIQSRRR